MTKWAAALLVLGLAASARADVAWRYEVAVGPKAQVLAVEVAIPPGASDELTIALGADRFVRGLEVGDGLTWHRAKATGESWVAPRCAVSGCRIRYHFLLGDAADLGEFAQRDGAAIVIPPPTFLIHPVHAPRGTQLRIHFDLPSGMVVIAGWPQVSGLDQVYQTSADALATAPRIVFRAAPQRR